MKIKAETLELFQRKLVGEWIKCFRDSLMAFKNDTIKTKGLSHPFNIIIEVSAKSLEKVAINLMKKPG